MLSKYFLLYKKKIITYKKKKIFYISQDFAILFIYTYLIEYTLYIMYRYTVIIKS